MKIIVKKTTELCSKDKDDICELFERVFHVVKTNKEFVHQFEKNEFGYSYFGLIYDDDKLIGSYAVIPLKFNYHKEELIFAQSIDTMIAKEYRGNPFLLKKLAEKVYKELKEDSIPFIFGFPNDNIYLVRKKILKWKDISNLDIHVLPIKIGAIKKKLSPFTYVFSFLPKILNIFINKQKQAEVVFPIHKSQTPIFEEYRFSDEYIKIILSKDTYSYYKIKEFKDIKTAFIVEVYPLTKNNIELTVKKICQSEENIDLIAYFGFLPFSLINLFKIPIKYKPKNTFMSGRILDNEKIGLDVFDIKNWRVNLSNFDWI